MQHPALQHREQARSPALTGCPPEHMNTPPPPTSNRPCQMAALSSPIGQTLTGTRSTSCAAWGSNPGTPDRACHGACCNAFDLQRRRSAAQAAARAGAKDDANPMPTRDQTPFRPNTASPDRCAAAWRIPHAGRKTPCDRRCMDTIPREPHLPGSSLHLPNPHALAANLVHPPASTTARRRPNRPACYTRPVPHAGEPPRAEPLPAFLRASRRRAAEGAGGGVSC